MPVISIASFVIVTNLAGSISKPIIKPVS